MPAIPVAVVLALAAMGARGATAPPPPAAPEATATALPHSGLLAAGGDVVVAHRLIPEGPNPHGEVVVLRRADATVVRTVLCSALLGRGLQAIRKKERARWPPDADGHADSRAFLAALDVTEDKAREEFLVRSNQNDERRKMMIEVVQGPAVSFVALYTIDARRQGDRYEVLAARPVVVRDVSVAYAAGAQRAQAGGALDLAPADLEALLGGG